VLGARWRKQQPTGARHDGDVDCDQPAEEVAQALDGRRLDQPRCPLFAGESYDENRFYSEPGDWPRLAESHRREFLERTDCGVFSLQAEATLNRSRGFRTLAGRAAAITAGERQVVVTTEFGDDRERVAYDLVVVAIGFDSRWFEAYSAAGHAAGSRTRSREPDSNDASTSTGRSRA
jgi:hypothetical protein